MKFNKLAKLKTITTCIVFVKYLLWCLFFVLQGKAIELAIEKREIPRQIICTLIGYIFVKILVMICDIFQKFLMERYKNVELRQQWNCHMPEYIYSDNQNSKSSINVLFFDYLPRMFELEISLVTNTVIICSVFTLTITAFLYTRFYVGIIALFLIFILNYLSKNIYVKKIDDSQKDTYYSKIKILNWVEQYFFSYREISKNWQGITNSSWKNEVYNKYFISKKAQIVFYFYRDLLAQLLVELPFLLNTSIVILGVYYKYLSLTQLFVWVGFSQFMINASNAYLENKINKKQLMTLNDQTKSILEGFDTKSLDNERHVKIDDFLSHEVIMKDGVINRLSLEPGLYHIKGGNGSGKSTLMNIFLGYERGRYDFKNKNLSSFIAKIEQKNVRVIDRHPIIFEDLTDFNSQICGPIISQVQWKKTVTYSLGQLLDANQANEWMKIFISLEAEYTIRKDKVLSSGEKVLLSFMRFLSSWNNEVNLLIIDECDSFLDQEKKKLFIMTINELACHMAIYISCHETVLSKFLNDSFICSKPNVVSCEN
ncbi:ATP-binding cassette domain-containing protein [Legionella fairfieldensis]|uniref:ATP-binding cassette domain-containing protein n=1 Tax=Legionella fairfieldensis TaxID=45064 RepID=UPI0004921DAC|nr:ATP-binding cassette domain-containing protein [Legionella fairfieldensis]